MSFKHTEDIDETRSSQAPKLNEQMSKAINRVEDAVEGQANLDSTFKTAVALVLQSVLYTHKSIILLLRHGNEEKYDDPDVGKEKEFPPTDMTLGADAMSLLREQIEKVFVVALLCDDPDRWVQEYLKDDWRRLYEHYLTQRDEMKDLPRHTRFYDVIAPEMIEKHRNLSNISDGELEAIEYKYYNPNTALPDRLKPYQGALKLFPTPGQAKIHVRDEAKPFLERLYKEYKFISGYNHAGLLKLQLLAMSDRRHTGNLEQWKKEVYYEKEVFLPALWTSYTAGVCACTEVLKFVHADLDVLAALTNFWESVRHGSLLARALWNLRGQSFFPPMIQ